ncbi:Crp/Fnr family transcriptional regulator [Sphingomonas sp. SRS2]|uniref:Crp/Fnr family transcriptional regulator n=1 Tax=Sphingomonas sp. SRS2 TaxID=133190 RepID=UPI001F444309|nr:Crp/Fnr family transcriptional regulator [Sphingomonas sp. SRS2]
MRAVVEPPQRVPARTVLIREGEPLNRSTLLSEGLMGRFKDMRDGERQISQLHISGDFLDLHSFTLKSIDHGVVALTDCQTSWASHAALEELTAEHPHLGRLLWMTTNLDAAMHRAWEVSLGRRDGLSRTAHLLCELHVRLGVVGMAEEDGYPLPLIQVDLAECLGLTAVHMNRVLRELRERRLVTFRSGRVQIHDLAGLRWAAEFTPGYLFLDKKPR